MTDFFKINKNIIKEISLLCAAGISIIIGGINIYILIFSVIIHELGHIIASFIAGAKCENINVHGFGVEISFIGKYPCPPTMFLISASGPLMSILLSIVAYFLHQTALFRTNLLVAFINLIPAFPLDGGNMLSAILSGFMTRDRVRRIMKYLGYFFGTIITLLGFLILYLSTFNISLLYMGLFIFFSAGRQQNPVIEIISANHKKMEKCSVFLIDGSMPMIEIADNMPVNSIGALTDNSGKITTLVTPYYLYDKLINSDEYK